MGGVSQSFLPPEVGHFSGRAARNKHLFPYPCETPLGADCGGKRMLRNPFPQWSVGTGRVRGTERSRGKRRRQSWAGFGPSCRNGVFSRSSVCRVCVGMGPREGFGTQPAKAAPPIRDGLWSVMPQRGFLSGRPVAARAAEAGWMLLVRKSLRVSGGRSRRP